MAEEKGKKKMNRWVFMILATLFNIVVLMVLFISLMLLLTYVAGVTGMGDQVFMVLAFIVIVGSFILSFMIYNKVASILIPRLGLDEEMKRK